MLSASARAEVPCCRVLRAGCEVLVRCWCGEPSAVDDHRLVRSLERVVDRQCRDAHAAALPSSRSSRRRRGGKRYPTGPPAWTSMYVSASGVTERLEIAHRLAAWIPRSVTLSSGCPSYIDVQVKEGPHRLSPSRPPCAWRGRPVSRWKRSTAVSVAAPDDLRHAQGRDARDRPCEAVYRAAASSTALSTPALQHKALSTHGTQHSAPSTQHPALSTALSTQHPAPSTSAV